MNARHQSSAISRTRKSDVHIGPSKENGKVEVRWSYDQELPELIQRTIPPDGRRLDWKGKVWIVLLCYLGEFLDAVKATGREVLDHRDTAGRELSTSQICHSFVSLLGSDEHRDALLGALEQMFDGCSENEREVLRELKKARDDLARA